MNRCPQRILSFFSLVALILVFGISPAFAGVYQNGIDGLNISGHNDAGISFVQEINIYNGIFNSNFTSNVASRGGGFNVSQNLYGGLWNSTFTGNRSTAAGGAAYISMLHGGIHNSTFLNNTSAWGGAVFGDSIDGGIHSSYFSGNRAVGTESGIERQGGAIALTVRLYGGITDTYFTSNSATSTGGAIHAPSLQGDISGSVFTNNSARAGGGIYSNYYFGSILNSTFRENVAQTSGGAFYMGGWRETNGIIRNSEFDSNTAGNTGGALFALGLDNVSIWSSRFINNVAGNFGGAIFVSTDQDQVRDQNGNSVSAVINFTLGAGAGEQLIFQGNRDSSGLNSLYFGRIGGGDSKIDANLRISGAGDIDLFDPLRVDMNNNKNFYFVRDAGLGYGELVWAGRNVIRTVGGTADFNFDSGDTLLLSNYTLVAEQGTDLQVTLGTGHEVRFELSDRDQNLAFIDYTNGSNAGLNIQNGTTVSTARSLLSTAGRYLLIDGYDFAGDSALDDIDKIKARLNFINKTGTKFDLELLGDQLWLVHTYTSSRGLWEYRPNVQRALYALDQLVRHTDQGIDMSDEEFERFHDDIDTTPPEVGVTMALVGMQTHTTMARHALRHAFSVSGGRFQTTSAFDALSTLRNNRSYGAGVSTPFRRGFSPKRNMLAETFMGERETFLPNILGNWSPATPEAAQIMAEAFGMGRFAHAAGADSFQNGVNLWMAYFGNFASADTHSGYMGYDTNTSGLLLGMTADITQAWSMGAYFGFSRKDADFDELSATADSDGVHVGLYTRYELFDDFTLTLDGAFSEYSTRTERSTASMSHSDGEIRQNVYSLGLELAYELSPWTHGHITPFIGARHTWSRQGAYSETGGVLSANVQAADTNSMTSVVGVSLAHDFIIDNSAVITPALELSWTHEYGDRYVKTLGNTFNTPLVTDEAHIKFDTFSMPRDRDIYQAGASLQARVITEKGYSVGLKAAYSIDISDNYTGHAVFAGAELAF